MLDRLAFSMSGGIIVLTSFIKQRLENIGVPSGKILVAADAVDVDAFSHADQVPNATADFVVGHIGTLKTMGMEKGVADGLRALAELPNNFKLLIVGGEEADVEFYKKMADELGVSPRADFLGNVPHADIPQYAARCNALVAPFPENEHYSYFMSPLKIFEYMASQQPIVSTMLPSIQEVLTNGVNALLVPPSEPTAFGSSHHQAA